MIRERFEAWFSDDGKWPKAVERDGKGDYILMSAASAWVHWRAALAWMTVEVDGLPPCIGDTYVGINSAGFAACFTVVGDEPQRECWMHTGEEQICVMSDLRWWRVLDRPEPDESSAGTRGVSRNDGATFPPPDPDGSGSLG